MLGGLIMTTQGELITTVHGDLAVMKRDTVVKEEDLKESKRHQILTLKWTGKNKINTLSMLVQCFK